MIFTFETYSAANLRMIKKIEKAYKLAKLSPMRVDELRRLEHTHDLILQRFIREIDEGGW